MLPTPPTTETITPLKEQAHSHCRFNARVKADQYSRQSGDSRADDKNSADYLIGVYADNFAASSSSLTALVILPNKVYLRTNANATVIRTADAKIISWVWVMTPP